MCTYTYVYDRGGLIVMEVLGSGIIENRCIENCSNVGIC